MNTLFAVLIAFNIGNYPTLLYGGKVEGIDACKARAQQIVDELKIPQAQFRCDPVGKSASI